VEGFEIDGSAVNDATHKATAGGISFKGDCRRIQANYNLIHDIGNGGIGTFNPNSGQDGAHQAIPGGADYVTIKGNRIYNACAWFTGGGGASGISLRGLYNTAPTYEDGRTVHNFIQQNRIYNCNTKQTAVTLTDNNGIIIDLAGGHDDASTSGVGYRRPAQTLIENNVVYRNDGRGIHVFKSSNVLARNNTCYQDLVGSQYTSEGELSASFAADVLFVNNVAVADGTNHPLNSYNVGGFASRGPNVVFRYNATGNGTNFYATGVTQYGNVTGVLDSDFYSVSTSDFRTVAISPYTIAAQRIVDVGSGTTSSFPNNSDFAPNDFYGANRPMGAQVDRGAFETSVDGLRGAAPAATTCAGSG